MTAATASRRGRPTVDAGAATIEFVLTALLLLVPLGYALLAALQVQRSAFAVTQAARSGARAFVTAPTAAIGRQRARRAVGLALGDQGVPVSGARVEIRCSAVPCLTPAGTVVVVVTTPVRLPVLPDLFGRPAAVVPVSAEQELTVDPYRPGRP